MTKFRYSKRPCKRCGTRRKYASNGHCVKCRKTRDAGRSRKTIRSKAEARLWFEYRIDIYNMTREQRDYHIALHFPNMAAGMGDWWKKSDGDIPL